MNNYEIKRYEILKELSEDYIRYGTFYKYIFKCVENNKINVIFYCKSIDKIKKFQNITQEKSFINVFEQYIKKLTTGKDYFQIIFNNDSVLKFVKSNNGARACRYHYAVVDNEVDKEIFYHVILPSDMLNQNYNIDFIKM